MKQQEAWKEERERGISKMIGLLKFITCGSVDDGKSTLIGHILYFIQEQKLKVNPMSV